MRLDRPLPPKKQPLASSRQTANSSDGVRPDSDSQQAGIRFRVPTLELPGLIHRLVIPKENSDGFTAPATGLLKSVPFGH